MRLGNDLYVPLGSSGVGKSTDGGNTFVVGNTGLNQVQVNNLLVAGNTVFASSYGGGTYRTTNGGAGWQNCNIGQPTNAGCYGMGKLGNTLFVGMNGVPSTIFKSINNGNSWSEVANTSWGRVESFFTVGSIIFAVSGDGLKRSTNGMDWISVTSPVLGSGFGQFGSGPDGKLYYSSTYHFAVSTDTGATWFEGIGNQDDDGPGHFAILNGKVFAGTSYSGVVFRNTSEFVFTANKPLVAEKECGFSIFPNPTSHNFSIQMPDGEMDSKVSLLGLKGELIRTWTNHQNLGIEGIIPGFYMVKLQTSKGEVIKKLMVE